MDPVLALQSGIFISLLARRPAPGFPSGHKKTRHL
jgi:hypothetical protein